MNRRGFIQTLGLLAGAAVVPPSMARGIAQLFAAGIAPCSVDTLVTGQGKLNAEQSAAFFRWIMESNAQAVADDVDQMVVDG